MINSQDFIKIFSAQNEDKSPKVAKVVELFDDGAAKVLFAGEIKPASKEYPCLGGYTPKAGDRVLMLPVAESYVIADAIRPPGWVPEPPPEPEPDPDPKDLIQDPDFMRESLSASDKTNSLLSIPGFLHTIFDSDEYIAMFNRLENVDRDKLWVAVQSLRRADRSISTKYAPGMCGIDRVVTEAFPDATGLFYVEVGHYYKDDDTRGWTFYSHNGKHLLTIYADNTVQTPKPISANSPYFLGRDIKIINTPPTRACLLNISLFY